MKAVLGAAALMTMACAADAATMGYQWAAGDGSLSMIIETTAGEQFFDLVAEGNSGRLGNAFRSMTRAGYEIAVDGTGLFAGLYYDDITDVFEVDGVTCNVLKTDNALAELDYQGLLRFSYYGDVVDDDRNPACESDYVRIVDVQGAWTSFGGAPAHPYEDEPPAPIPLPASALLLGGALAGLGLVRRRSGRPSPR